MRIADPIAYFEGRWTFERKVQDHLAEAVGVANGDAVFSPEGDGLRWRESGRLEIGQAKTRATRELRIVPDRAVGSGWMVTFDDGRPFHPLDLGSGECEVDHPCRDDLYEGQIEADGDDRFHTIWVVSGPAKDQRLETAYRRSL